MMIMTSNWTARASDQGAVLVGAGAGKNVRVGPLPINMSLPDYYNADWPKDASQWQLRFQVQLLFHEPTLKEC